MVFDGESVAQSYASGDRRFKSKPTTPAIQTVGSWLGARAINTVTLQAPLQDRQECLSHLARTHTFLAPARFRMHFPRARLFATPPRGQPNTNEYQRVRISCCVIGQGVL